MVSEYPYRMDWVWLFDETAYWIDGAEGLLVSR